MIDAVEERAYLAWLRAEVAAEQHDRALPGRYHPGWHTWVVDPEHRGSSLLFAREQHEKAAAECAAVGVSAARSKEFRQKVRELPFEYQKLMLARLEAAIRTP
jgi:hypothetical protein